MAGRKKVIRASTVEAVSATTIEYMDVRATLHPLLEGVVVSIDPSIGSSSSMPGYAVSRRGDLVASGTLEIQVVKSIPERLRAVSRAVQKLFNKYKPDVLVYEQIAPRRYGGGSAHSHASLLKAVGAILAVPGPEYHVGLRPTVWKKLVRDSYEKGDEEDAIEMLYIALALAAHIDENDRPRNYGKPSKSVRERNRRGA